MHNNIQSEDDRFASKIKLLIKLLDIWEIDYAFIGSCALQSHFPYCQRLPNDADVLIDKNDFDKAIEELKRNNLKFNIVNGRIKFQHENKFFDLITTEYRIINDVDQSCVGTLSLESCLSKKQSGSMKLLFSKEILRFNIISAGYCLFLELVRPLNTNSFMGIIQLYDESDFVTQNEVISDFNHLMNANIHFSSIVIENINDIIQKIYETKLDRRFNHSLTILETLYSKLKIKI
jgi:hypothetical protein